LKGIVNRVLDDHRPGWLWLRFVPSVHLFVDGRQGLGFSDYPLGLGVPGPGGEQGQRNWADVRLQPFPGLMAYRACNRSCTIELLLSGLKATISLIAATMIQNWAEDKNSKDTVIGAGVPPV
jgi:hypothetical protein